MKLLSLLFLWVIFAPSSNGSNILVLTPFGSNSVRAMFECLSEGLLKNGHEVTLISSGDPFFTHENFKHIESPHTALDQLDLFHVRMGLSVFQLWKKAFPEAARQMYQSDEIMNIWKRRMEFDAIIINSAANEMAFPFLLNTTVPFITLQPAGIDPLQLAYLGNLVSPATMPSIILPYDSEMSFFERFVNTLTLMVMKYSFRRSVGIPLAESLKPFFPELPDPRTVYPQQTLAMFNSHFLIDGPVPLLPNQVEVGCLSCRQPLPIQNKKILNFIESSSENNVIFFSLGSFQKPDKIPSAYSKIVYETFKRLPQYRFLVHLVTSVDEEEVPSHMLLSDWYPQQDVLAHQSTALFISHCGRQSVNQALYHGVPVLGIPIAFDQPRHCGRLSRRGEAVTLTWEELTDEMLEETIIHMMTNSNYTEKVRKVSERFSAQKETGLDKAIWHIEYVISQGGDLLRYSGMNLSIAEYLLLDVMLLIATILSVVTILSYFTLRTVYRMCRRGGEKKMKTQ